MKPLHFLFIAATGALSSCGSMNDPIYYDAEEANVIEVSQKNAPSVAPTPANVHIAPVTVKQQASKKTDNKGSSPFMQPNVFSMPKNEDLKETATSTRSNSSSPGLTVPN